MAFKVGGWAPNLVALSSFQILIVLVTIATAHNTTYPWRRHEVWEGLRWKCSALYSRKHTLARTADYPAYNTKLKLARLDFSQERGTMLITAKKLSDKDFGAMPCHSGVNPAIIFVSFIFQNGFVGEKNDITFSLKKKKTWNCGFRLQGRHKNVCSVFFNSSLSYLSEFKSGYLAGVIFPNSIFPYFSKASVADYKDAEINFKSKQTLVKDIDSVASFSYYTCCLNITVCFSERDAPTV